MVVFPVLPLVKIASVAGFTLGVGDSVVQWARGRNMPRRLARVMPGQQGGAGGSRQSNRSSGSGSGGKALATWDCGHSVRVAIAGAAIGAFVGAPFMLIDHSFLECLGGFAITEAMLVPLVLGAGTRSMRRVTAQVPVLLISATVAGVAASAVVGLAYGHVPAFAFLRDLAVSGPENIILSYGLGCASFLYFCFAQQEAIWLKQDQPGQRVPVTLSAMFGGLGSISLLVNSVVSPGSIAHPLFGDFFLGLSFLHAASLLFFTNPAKLNRETIPAERQQYNMRRLFVVVEGVCLLVLIPSHIFDWVVERFFVYAAGFSWCSYLLTYHGDFAVRPGGGYKFVPAADQQAAYRERERDRDEMPRKGPRYGGGRYDDRSASRDYDEYDYDAPRRGRDRDGEDEWDRY
eukprot:TRINITY_DN94881_c0_g1_i1.p1 TRINITY_DN94881_c0_g1~~TRINITY_DN94881_c0_g1_i1.p1  ORF type:complete len:403 (+),score=49.17 TRINITY_DN94881_c0_g1_i1:145-1353(+)